MKNWRDCLSYPQNAGWEMGEEKIQMLDILLVLLPMPEEEDRYVRLAQWLRDAESQGLLRAVEHQNLRSGLGKLL